MPTPNCASTINYNESLNFPSVLTRSHYYSAKYSADILFTGSPVNISVEGDDGFRLWVDDELVINDFTIQQAAGSLKSVTRTWNAGSHRVSVEYFERTAAASLVVHITDTRDGSELPHTGAGSPAPAHGPAPTVPFTPGYSIESWAQSGTGDMTSRLNTGVGSATAMVADASGNFYVADAGRDVVFKIQPSGASTVIAGTLDTPGFSGDFGPAGAAKLNDPSGLAFDSSGNLFISDSSNNRIRMISAGSNFATSTIRTMAGSTIGYANGSGTSAQFSTPTDLSFWNSVLYVADVGNHRIRGIDLGGNYGQVSTFAGSGATGGGADFTNKNQWGFAKISDIYVSNNWIHIADEGNSQVLEVNFTENSNIHIVADSSGSSGDGFIGQDAMVNNPTAIVGSAFDNTYFIEGGNSTMRVVRVGDETIWTAAGGGNNNQVDAQAIVNGDGGPALNATLQKPIDILAVGGSYYVLEANFAIRRLLPTS